MPAQTSNRVATRCNPVADVVEAERESRFSAWATSLKELEAEAPLATELRIPGLLVTSLVWR
jgi:hypothetical protein